MKKNNFLIILFFLFSFIFFSTNTFGFELFKKTPKPALFLTSYNPSTELQYDKIIKSQEFFKTNSRIYFQIYNPKGFKADYIKYQIIKQDDNAHTGGYSRIRNITSRLKNKNYYSNYFTLSEAGKYYLQIFDIENLQQWVAIAHFTVEND